MTPHTEITSEDRKKLSDLLGFTEGLLQAREKVQMEMQSGLGVFHEGNFAGTPGVHFDAEDGAWLRIDRQRETRPPEPVDYVSDFLIAKPSDPAKKPQIRSAILAEVTIEDASDLMEADLVMPDDVRTITEDGIVIENRVKVILHAANCPEMKRDFERYVGGPWSDWSRQEMPIRRAIALYNDLFKIHSAIHTSEGTPPELVWGIGIGRWSHSAGRIDMPIMEQMVDIEIEDGGAIVLRPRDITPRLSLKPYLELDIDGAHTLQRELQSRLVQMLGGSIEFSPFTTLWEPLLDAAASNLSSTALHVTRAELDEGEKLPSVGPELRIASSWAIFGRPRSNEARLDDIKALRKQIDDESSEIPESIRGFAAPLPDAPEDEASDYGLDLAVLGGATSTSYTTADDEGARPGAASGTGTARPASDDSRKVYFFPLPFNREQGKIADMIDDPKVQVACVSGPPGTGKSHSIANIISHQMALGKRVLVTARTPEAIAAVREKLPESLRPLVIASVGTDRESAQQLQDAVQELSREVVSLDAEQAQAQRAQLESQIIECDQIAAEADRNLAEIARANLVQVDWNGTRPTPMELVDILGESEDEHGWFTDRPAAPPPIQLDDVLARLKSTLPALAADIAYAGADLPRPDDLPATAELIAAHEAELAWAAREVVDYSSAPRMARDSVSADAEAGQALRELEALCPIIDGASTETRAFAIRALRDEAPINRSALEALQKFLADQTALDTIAEVRFDLGSCSFEEFMAAATRGASGQKPVGFGLFNGALKEAAGSVRVAGKTPSSSQEWQIVLEACRLKRDEAKFDEIIRPLVAEKLMNVLPSCPWEIACYLKESRQEIASALAIADRLKSIKGALRSLFPYGLDVAALCDTLDSAPAIFALRGNMPDNYTAPEPLARLRAITGDSMLPVNVAIRQLAEAIGKPETNPQDIVAARGEITQELIRLAEVFTQLQDLGNDLDALRQGGAPDLAAKLEDTPDMAPQLVPETWRDAWAWGQMKAHVERIVALGNGDDHRRIKADALKRRRRLFEELIRIRTLLGLKRRMTGSIRQAMEAFTQAVSKIGTGKGKKAPRFIRAARDAAQKASSAAPVWIMPEYKIPEQLPANFGDFDLAILDEASQSDITALSALARGKKILVVGDEEQVSPSVVGIPVQKINALRAEFLHNLPNADLIDENSSIFEVTKRMHPESHVMLREHFRCVAPIIQFSTRFYNNALIPLRVPKASERFNPPLADVYIPGATRQGKTNPFEARWIVDEIARLIDDPVHASRDIGVISLIGAEQSEKIGRMLVEDPRIGPEKIEERRIIYGDARTMQGQERSIVFLSMVATPGHAHAQTMKADQQRINVAMSRARDRLYLVRSVRLEDLKQSDIKAQILQHFANPMPEGRGATIGEIDELMERCDSGFEREVLKRLMHANYRVRPQVAAGGFRIDLVVEGQEDRRLAIELDGDQYHGPDVWEADMIRQAALERAGWVFWRVFGSQWQSNKDYWWRNLLETLDRLDIFPIGAEAIDERFTETVLVDLASDLEEEHDKVAGDAFVVEQNAFGVDTAVAAKAGSFPDLVGAPESERETVSEQNVPAEAPFEKTMPGEAFQLAQARSDLAEDDLFSIAKSRGERTTVTVGSTVRLEKLGNGGGKLEVTLVEDGHDADQGMIGIHTPLGQALIDAEIGEDVEYRAGAYILEVRILDVA